MDVYLFFYSLGNFCRCLEQTRRVLNAGVKNVVPFFVCTCCNG